MFLGPSLITPVECGSFEQPAPDLPSSLSFISRTATSSTLTDLDEPIVIDVPVGSNSDCLPPAPPEETPSMDVVDSATSQGEEATTHPMDVDQVQRDGSVTPTNSTQSVSVSSSQVFDLSSQQTRNPTPPNQSGGSYLLSETQSSTSSFTTTNAGSESAALYSGNHYPAVKPPRPRTVKSKAPRKPSPPLSTKDMYNFSPSNLTYDSFWSSHTPQPSTSRGPRMSLPDTSVVGLPPAKDYRRGQFTIPTSSQGSLEERNQQAGGPPA
jgi:hypothetical protein